MYVLLLPVGYYFVSLQVQVVVPRAHFFLVAFAAFVEESFIIIVSIYCIISQTFKFYSLLHTVDRPFVLPHDYFGHTLALI